MNPFIILPAGLIILMLVTTKVTDHKMHVLKAKHEQKRAELKKIMCELGVEHVKHS